MNNNSGLELKPGQRWARGHMGRFWDDGYKRFDYVRQSVTQEEVDDWVSKGYDYVKSYTGEMYDSRNPMPEWTERLKTMFALYKNMTFTFYKMNTLEIMPEHADHYRTYRRLFGAEYENTYRILVMLEDWKPGHYLEVDGVGIVNWIAGDYFIWRSDCPHAASNIGTQPRYTLQITAESVNPNDCWSNLHYYNIPSLHTHPESKIFMMARLFSLLPVEHQAKPLFIYMYNGKLKDLDDISHSDDEIQYLNNEGVNFYLTEPLCSYLDKSVGHDMSFYSEFIGDETNFRSDELDSIVTYIERNKLTKVTVYTCDHDAEKWYPYYKPYMKVATKDMFVASLTPKVIHDEKVEPNFKTKFMCLNWRYTMHRNMIAAYVSRLSSNVSWYFRGDFDVLGKSKWFNLDSIRESNSDVYFKLLKGISILNSNAPMNVDLDVGEATTITNKSSMQYMPMNSVVKSILDSELLIEQKYKDIFVDVVTESRFAQPTGNYSEKVYQPMWYKKPFVLAAPPFTLKSLREEGFKTFSDFWDESYDTETVHANRLLKIFEVIDYIDSKSIDELQEMYKQMQSIVDHNYRLMCERTPKII